MVQSKKPEATEQDTGWSKTGGATSHACLQDASDASKVSTSSTDVLEVKIQRPDHPNDYILMDGWTLRVRGAAPTGARCDIALNVSGSPVHEESGVVFDTALADFDITLGSDAATSACDALDDIDVVIQNANGNVEVSSVELILPDRVLRVHTGG